MAGAKAVKATEVLTINFTLEKETKNALRYAEDGATSENRGKIGTLYIQKTTLPDTPTQIVVTVARA